MNSKKAKKIRRLAAKNVSMDNYQLTPKEFVENRDRIERNLYRGAKKMYKKLPKKERKEVLS